MLCSVDWQLHNVSEHVSLILNGQAIQEASVTTNIRWVISQKSKDLIYNAAVAYNHELPLLLSYSRPGIYVGTLTF